MTANVPAAWAGFLQDWDRSLRSGNYPPTTRYNYLLAAVQLARYLVDHQPDGQAAHTPAAVTRQQIEAFQAWMVQTRCASTALNKHKALQQFVHLRDQAIIRLLYDTGARLSEVANLNLEDVDLALDSVRFHGKGAKDRRVRIGPKTARGVSRYLRARSGHPGFVLPSLWLAVRGAQPLCGDRGRSTTAT